MEQAFRELKARLAEVQDVKRASEILRWDQQTMMPPRGGAVRAEQLATLKRIGHERFAAPETARLLEQVETWEATLPYESDEASIIRFARREYDKARRVPADLRADIERLSALAYAAWVDARRASDFEQFLPYLKRMLELKLRYIECFADVVDDPYDALLDDYEAGMTTGEVTAVFDSLKAELLPFIAEMSGTDDGDDPLRGPFAVETQRRVQHLILERFGFDADSWRLDPTVHPFAASGATTDIRITSRYDANSISALFVAMHEFGHGLYERHVSPSLERTPVARGASYGLHESQSRMWENLVGRGRPFWRYFYPHVQAAFPEQLGAVDEERFYRAVNRVKPSTIRVDADEATYNFHIILRFELEQELFAGTLKLRELPEAWRARMKEYLGVDVPDDASGVLQDVHWSRGSFGYFPTYSLGNVMSVQIWERLREDIVDLDDQVEHGDFSGLRGWLTEHLYRHGRKFMPKETLARVVGGPIDPAPYVAYLKRKLGEIYAVAGRAAR